LHKIVIKDKENLKFISQVVSWLDDMRWDDSINNDQIKYSKKLTNSEKILTHWLCYITDRQTPFERVWNEGGHVFSELVYDYTRKNQLPTVILNNHYEKYLNGKNEEKYRFKSSDKRYFASRFVTDDYQNIKQTLEILNQSRYHRNIVSYIIDMIDRFESDEDFLHRIACSLFLLTYKLDNKESNADKIIGILSSERDFDNELKKFKRNSTNGKKRLWCCIRDYKKGTFNTIFNEAIRENSKDTRVIKIWNQLPMNQIELPGDVWNNSPLFRNNLLGNVIELSDKIENWGMPKVVRNVYNQVEQEDGFEKFYPEQFDITFDFVPRMCNKELCDVCPFGKDGAKSICISNDKKNCPVSLVTCGYVRRCVGPTEKCIIREGLGKGLCKGIRNNDM